jgi:hypothetical protein
MKIAHVVLNVGNKAKVDSMAEQARLAGHC